MSGPFGGLGADPLTLLARQIFFFAKMQSESTSPFNLPRKVQLSPGIFTKSVCFYVEISQSQFNLSLGRSWGVLGETWGLPGSTGQALKADFVAILRGCATWGFIGQALESRFCRYFTWVRHLGLHWASLGKQILSLFHVGAPLEAWQAHFVAIRSGCAAVEHKTGTGQHRIA